MLNVSYAAAFVAAYHFGMHTPSVAAFAANLTTEIAFDVLAVARRLKAAG